MEAIQNALKMSRYHETKVFFKTPILDNCFVKKPDLHVFVSQNPFPANHLKINNTKDNLNRLTLFLT